MTTMATTDRVVHHSVTLDLMTMDSYRARQASDQHNWLGDQPTAPTSEAGEAAAQPACPT